MILKSLKLENIRSYAFEKIDFPDDSVLLSGDIGSGKSSILLAIEFALFGIRRGELSGSSLLRHGKQRGEVELEFEIDNQNIIIKRILKRSKDNVTQDSGYMIINNRKIEATPVELKSKILALLGYPEEILTKSKSLIYRYTVYTPQEGMKQILLEEKDIRLDTLRKVFGIDKYKTIRENIVIFVREIKRKASELKIKTQDLNEKLSQKREREQDVKEINIKITEQNSRLIKTRELISEKKQEIEQVQAKIKQINELKNKLDVKNTKITEKSLSKIKTNKNMDEITAQINEYEKKLEKFRHINELIDERGLEKELKKKEEEYNLLNNQESIFSERINSTEKMITQLKKEIQECAVENKELIVKKARINELEEKITEKESLLKEKIELNKKLELVKLKINEKNIQKNNSTKIKQDIEKLSKCPLCLQEVTSMHKQGVIESQNKTIKQVNEFLSRLLRIQPKLEKKISELESGLEDIRQLESNIIRFKAELQSLEKSSNKIVEKQKLLTKLSNEKQTYVEKLDEIRQKNPDKIRQEIIEDRKKSEEIRKNNYGFIEKQNIIKSINDKKSNLEKLNDELANIKTEIKKLSSEVSGLNIELKKFKNTEKEMALKTEQLENIHSREKELEIKIAELLNEKKSISLLINNILKEIEEKTKVRETINYLNQLRNWLEEYFLNLMVNIEKHVMYYIYSEFNSLLKEWFSILIEEIDISLDEDFSLKIIQDGYETEFENLSGGEKTSVALSYRLALNKVINDLIGKIKTKDIIILDEPTYGFSTEQLDKVREVFDRLDMKQVIIVSHEQKMESFVKNIIRINKTDNISKVIY
ncbi:SMC family ATPase [Candidatus Woesearchaeota archaeon]|nr:SMC family ATPase [Candidatus Woesearchaeota archaeon]